MNVISNFWIPLTAIVIVGSIIIALVFVLMVKQNILMPIKTLMSMTDLIMGTKKIEDRAKANISLEKLKQEIIVLEQKNAANLAK